MPKNNWIASLLLGALISIGSAQLQAQCTGCQTGNLSQGPWPSANGSRFSGGGRMSQRHENFRAWHDDYRQKAQVITDRNSAWPKPFNCTDRMSYFSLMGSTFESGWIAQCSLTGVHFDQSTGELNAAGRNKVQSIINNNPLDRRTVFIVHNTDADQTQQRLERVRQTVGDWYGEELANQVAVTDRIPMEVSGQRIEQINTMYRAGLPVPAIQVGSGGASSSAGATK